tara:strand:+ start:7407 stop:7949 length:543 start_codon:yes stop_codon:yes gene_type:complete
MIKINMGCGWRNFGSDWVHIDGGDYDHLDYESITNLNQFKDNSVDLIYASHVIEYFDCEEIKKLLKEWKRILSPEGKLRLAVPDFSSMCSLYSSGISLNHFTGPLYGRMPMGDKWIYHKTVYDFKSITVLLEGCGFTKVELYEWDSTEHSDYDDHSQAYYPHMDKVNGTLISLNVECKLK